MSSEIGNPLSELFERICHQTKKEEGQYFTPMPIVNFILKSIPLDDVVKKSMEKGELPYVIDAACGSGNFLNGVIKEYSRIIESEVNKCSEQIKQRLVEDKQVLEEI